MTYSPHSFFWKGENGYLQAVLLETSLAETSVSPELSVISMDMFTDDRALASKNQLKH